MLESSYVQQKDLAKWQLECQYTLTPHTDIGTAGLMFACLPSSICTEMLACDKSTPVLCSACVSVSNNLPKYNRLSLIY